MPTRTQMAYVVNIIEPSNTNIDTQANLNESKKSVLVDVTESF